MRIPSHPRIRAQAPYGANPSARSALVCDVSNAPATTRACANTRDRSCRAHLDPALDVHNGRHRRRVVSCSAATTRVVRGRRTTRAPKPHVAYWVGGDKTRETTLKSRIGGVRAPITRVRWADVRRTRTHAHTHTYYDAYMGLETTAQKGGSGGGGVVRRCVRPTEWTINSPRGTHGHPRTRG